MQSEQDGLDEFRGENNSTDGNDMHCEPLNKLSSSERQFDPRLAMVSEIAPEKAEIAGTDDDLDSDNELLVGTLINEQYRVLSKLRSGGMSHVYRCDDLQLNRLVAIKLLRIDPFGNSHSAKRFQREAQIVSMLEQESIVKLYGLHLTENRQPFIVMEFVDGESLDELLERSGSLPLPRVIKFISQICDALMVAHAHGVIHRDLKPANIMVMHPGQVNERLKLLDFGIAKVANNHSVKTTRTGEVFGSPAYMSPEQAQGRIVDERTDQYSLGCLIFELLTGRIPFRCDNFLSMMMAHVQETAPMLSEVSKKAFPLSIELAVARLLEKEPAHRFASIGDVKRAFVGAEEKQIKGEKGTGKGVPSTSLISTAIAVISLLALFGASACWRTAQTDMPNCRAQNQTIPDRLTGDEKALFNHLQAEPTATVVDLRNKKITDIGMTAFAGCHRAESIGLVHCYKVTDAGLKYLVGLPLLRLYLTCTQLSDAGMKSVCSISTLESLDISETDVSDEGCKFLEHLDQLRELHASRTFITSAVLSSIAKLTNLEELYLNGDNISDDLSALAGMRLRELSLRDDGLTDANMSVIAKMKSLLQLDLSKNRDITDVGLLKLAELSDLRVLTIADCSITEAGLRKFKALRPQCFVRIQEEGPEKFIKSMIKSASR